MPRFLRKLVGCFIINKLRRHALVENWTGNKIIIVEENGKERTYSPFAKIKGITFSFDGSGNVLRLHKPFCFKDTRILLEKGSLLDIGANATVQESHFALMKKI